MATGWRCCGRVLLVFASLFFYSLNSNNIASAEWSRSDADVSLPRELSKRSIRESYNTNENVLKEQNREVFYVMVGIFSGAVMLVLCIGVYCWWNVMQTYKMDTSQKERLIENIRRFPSLYDPGDRDYRNRVVNDEAWTAIADILSEDVETCRRIWKNLRDSFHRIDKRRQQEECKPSGMKRRCISWPFYDPMLFLKPHVLNFYHYVDDIETEENYTEQKQNRFLDDKEIEENFSDVRRQTSYADDTEENYTESLRKRRRSADGDSVEVESSGVDSVNLYMPCPYCNTSVLNLQKHLRTECMRNSSPQERRTTYQEIEAQVCEASEFFLIKESLLIEHAGGKTTVAISDVMDILEEFGFFVIRDAFDRVKQEPVVELDSALDKEIPCKQCPCCLWQIDKEMCLPDKPSDSSVDATLLSTSVKLSADTLKHVGTLADKMETIQSSLKQIVSRITSSDQKLDDITTKLTHLNV